MPKVTLGRYMWERFSIQSFLLMKGVPGDFNLQFLDAIFEVKGLKWVGNQNELNAAYAADGYARIKEVPGCLVTTHGVGELSALNGVAGAMSERVKMIHVVGQTTRAMQDNRMMIHHSIGDKPDHQQYNKASKGLRCAAAELWDVETAPAEIDRVLRECFLQSGPVYIFLPLDLSSEEVSADLLKRPIDLAPQINGPAQEKAISAIQEALAASKHPSVLVDALAHRFDAVPETRDLVSKMKVPFFSTNMGKGLVDETEETYVGLWNGEIGTPGVKETAQLSDLIVCVGYLPADTNSGGFSRKFDENKAIHINPFDVMVKGLVYPNIHIKSLLAALVEALPSNPKHSILKLELPPPRIPKDAEARHTTQSWLWPRFSQFLRPGDILIGETGTTVFGICDNPFPKNIRFQAQIYYGSIGWATPATLGAELARQELNGSQGRTILVTGDGSLAMTIQEVGTMIKAGLKPIIFVINNDGYTVERMIWGAQQAYNDIVPTSYSYLLPLFKHPSPSTSFHRAQSKAELEKILDLPQVKDPQNLQLVEVVVDKLDTAWRLGSQLAVRGEKQREYLTREGFVDTYGDWGLVDGGDVDVKWN
ncbi:pyruvate decarboxylase [Lojkania enalia]|uniref:Pyruvate decarboxylase n=1 Tax=Lojkania enalia TaxID=147567 RepID=A0A9P4K930_9PLEO|nr:pyruvate decarboxylase [Didymosphaeria enalia]